MGDRALLVEPLTNDPMTEVLNPGCTERKFQKNIYGVIKLVMIGVLVSPREFWLLMLFQILALQPSIW